MRAGSMLGGSMLGADEPLFLGNDLLPWLVLAVGAALVVANVAALVRPPQSDDADTSERLERPPLGRVLPLIVLGLVVSIWAGVSLAKG